MILFDFMTPDSTATRRQALRRAASFAWPLMVVAYGCGGRTITDGEPGDGGSNWAPGCEHGACGDATVDHPATADSTSVDVSSPTRIDGGGTMGLPDASPDRRPTVIDGAVPTEARASGGDASIDAAGDALPPDALGHTSAEAARDAADAGPDGSLDSSGPTGNGDGGSVSGDPADALADATSDGAETTPIDAGCSARRSTGTTHSTYQANRAHDGYQPLDQVALPFCKRWTFDLGATMSYPLVANGRVFVVGREPTNAYGSRLFALDLDTGAVLWGPISLGGVYYWAGLTWDAGRVFTVNGDGELQAFDEATGTSQWSVTIPNTFVDSPGPVAFDGRVYVVPEQGTAYAFETETGGIAWSVPVQGGSHLSPAFSDSTMYVTRGCASADAIDLSTHQVVHGTSTCANSGGGTPVYAGGRLYAHSFYGAAQVFDAATVASLYPFNVSMAPAVTPSFMYGVFGGDLIATVPDGTTPSWSFSGYNVALAPLVVGNVVVVVGGSTVWALDATTGAVLGSDALPGSAALLDEWNDSTPVTGLAAADGILLVPTTGGLVAY